jgi:hypothetical protein
MQEQRYVRKFYNYFKLSYFAAKRKTSFLRFDPSFLSPKTRLGLNPTLPKNLPRGQGLDTTRPMSPGLDTAPPMSPDLGTAPPMQPELDTTLPKILEIIRKTILTRTIIIIKDMQKMITMNIQRVLLRKVPTTPTLGLEQIIRILVIQTTTIKISHNKQISTTVKVLSHSTMLEIFWEAY